MVGAHPETTNVPVEVLRAEARYQRERYDLYRARAYAGKPVSDVRLRELQRTSEAAEERLRAARRTSPR